MRITRLFLYFIILSLGVISSSCSDDDKEEEEQSYKIGVHKFEIEISGDEDLDYTAMFTGVSESGVSKLYDIDGNLIGNQKMYSLTVGDCKKLVCYTDNEAVCLSLIFSISGDGQEYSYTIKSYINDNLIDTISEKGTVNFSQPVMISVMTQE